jgi:hypothetical protein
VRCGVVAGYIKGLKMMMMMMMMIIIIIIKVKW